MKRLAIVLALSLCASLTELGPGEHRALASTLNVPGDFPTIQSAILAAAGGDEVLVAPGTYTENISFRGKAIALRRSSGPGSTILDGSGKTAGPDTGCVVRFLASESAASVLEGFTLTGGMGMRRDLGGDFFQVGGAIVCLNASPKIHDCVFTGNTLSGLSGGGGLFGQGGAPQLDHVTIEHNAATAGGAAWLLGSAAVFQSCTFRQNSAEVGGGLQTHGSAAQIMDCEIAENHANDSGGGIRILDGTGPDLVRTNIHDNDAKYAGGVKISGAELRLNACTLSGNHAELGGAIAADGATGFVTACRIIDNTATNLLAGDGGAAGIGCTSSPLNISDCLFALNSGAEARGSAIEVFYDPSPQVLRCTFSDNVSRGNGGGAILIFETSPTISQSIVAFSSNASAFVCQSGANPAVTCCDVFGNEKGDAICGQPVDDFASDPKFCDRANRDFTLRSSSPCVAGQHPGATSCDLIGAYPVGCTDTPTRVVTWGRIKGTWR